MHPLVLLFSDFSAGIIPLSQVLTPNRIHHPEDFSLFLSNLLVYGSGYDISDASTPFTLTTQREKALFEISHMQCHVTKMQQHAH